MQKRTVKVALLAVFTVVLVFGLSTVALAQTWSDLPDTVTAEYGVTNDQVAAISEGYPGGLWQPYQAVTRAQFTKMAVAAFDISLVTATSASYADVPVGSFYSPYVEAARAAEIIDPATNFNPNSPITRQQALAIICRYLADANGYELATMYSADEIAALLVHFGDVDSISAVFKEEMAFAYHSGITAGNKSGNLDPWANLTRIQGATMLIRAQAGSTPLKAGAGSSPIVFPAAMFDPALPNLEGFDGTIHDNPYARVLVLQGNIKVAICSLELVNIPSYAIDFCKEIVSTETGVPEDNVWIHATHAITTPHVPGNADHAPTFEEVQATYYYTAVENAITEAAQQAADSFQNALAGWGTGTCDVNMNRDVLFPDGKWYIGLGSTLPSNKTMTVLRLDSLFGDPIGFFISYGIKPTCIDNSEMAAKTRQISSDVPGLACRLMEEEFGAPALFGMPAAGDQVPTKWCWYQAWDPSQNKAVWVDEGVANGLTWVQELGTTMGDDAIGIAENISCTATSRKIAITQGSFTTQNKTGGTDVDIPVGVIRFGDSAFVGFKPELNCVTEQELWAASPYSHTILLSFLNGDQRYMPDADSYTWGLTGSAEAQKSPYVAGSAEQLRDYALDLLNLLKD